MAAKISTVVAIGYGGKHNRVIGKDNKLLWRIPDDLKRFRELTTGHPVVMGRKTFESIVGYRGDPLPNRPNIVITRDKEWKYDHQDVTIVHSLEEGIAKAREMDDKEIFIGGGTQVYEQALPMMDRLYLTLVEDDKEGDSYFPPYEHLFTKKTFEEAREHGGLTYRWVNLEREK